MSLLSILLVSMAGLSLAAMVVLLIVASRSAREVRATIFPIVREEGTLRVWRARIVAIGAGVVAAVMAGAFFLSGQIALPGPMLSPPPAATISEAPGTAAAVEQGPTVIPRAGTTELVAAAQASSIPGSSQEDEGTSVANTAVPVTAVPPSATSTLQRPASTPTVAPSATPTTVAEPGDGTVLAAMPPSPAPAGAPAAAPGSAKMGPITFAPEIDDGRHPVHPTEVFSDTVNRVYAVFPYGGMQKGLKWTYVWYFNNVEFIRDESAWQWGSEDRSYVFITPVGAGDYRLDLYVNGEMLSSGGFNVQGPVAVGGPESR